MRDLIARALSRLLSVLAPHRPGRHSAEYLAALTPEPEPEPAPVNPWTLPWPGPTKEEAAAFFRQQAEATLDPRAVTRERLRAAALATMGVDHPYTYEGAPTYEDEPFGVDAFTAAAG